MPEFKTERLEMHTLTADMMEAVLKGGQELKRIVPFDTGAEWPLEVYKNLFPYKIERFRKVPSENEWEGLIVDKTNNRIVGDMGFKGGPNEEGVIDLGYSIIPSSRGKGFATEMGKAMVAWGLTQPGVKKVMASCDPDNAPSIRVLEKIGFERTVQTDDSIYWLY